MREVVKIGMEVHIELGTESKMFCRCPAEHFGVEPNTHTCPVCLGLPGALPVPNQKAVLWCIKTGLALNCRVREGSTFDRKNYFYPDLPKGFQISQYDDPFCREGYLKIEDEKRVGIRRVHMEEDTGKLIHREVEGEEVTLVDFNRSGVPLIEIVTEPDMNSSEEAVSFVRGLQRLVRYLGVSDCDMEKGSMRLEANISVVREGEEADYKVEVKNLNSFKFLGEAIEYEIERQKGVLEKGDRPVQETRGFNPEKGETFVQRSKETAEDYRYFPEPDIPPIDLGRDTELGEKIERLKKEMPRLPREIKLSFIEDFSLRDEDAEILISKKEEAGLFEKVVKILKGKEITPQEVANVIVNKRVDLEGLSPKDLADLLVRREESKIDDRSKLDSVVKKAIEEEKEAVQDYLKGEEAAVGVLVGYVMKETEGKADGEVAKEMIVERLEDMK